MPFSRVAIGPHTAQEISHFLLTLPSLVPLYISRLLTPTTFIIVKTNHQHKSTYISSHHFLHRNKNIGIKKDSPRDYSHTLSGERLVYV